ncbi:alcohol dehydrogenase catalytic domain-containing protein [Armatimonas rosea]|uniref:Threonine dehydrogenase-like Zn-dependent dehydrogenase n=1 Tax=Armatimonas rosea TaxID=685828 RepID=A0A7W9SLS0_ARMRO|nr:threonine dehydrogenase-like Zn-dependent dehydrogenase [Armatimonas rosea]
MNLPTSYKRWHLYGAGLESVRLETVPLVPPGPDEILMRHDACGICFSDIKIINLGGEHPRLTGRDLANNPVVMGHEVTLTVVAVGERRTDRFAVGQRFIVQADVYYKGTNLAYGYAITGGMSQYGLIGKELLDGDEGCYLLPLDESSNDAEGALVEPWACVEASYRWKHRTAPTADGDYLLIPTNLKVRLADDPAGRRSIVQNGVVPDPPHGKGYDDIYINGDAPAPEVFEAACKKLAKNGTVYVRVETPLARPVAVDVGRIHYDGHAYIGPKENQRNEILGGGVSWFIGAAGPMGMMHAQRALSLPEPPRLLLITDRHDARLQAVADRFGALAKERGVELILCNVRTGPEPDLKAIAPDGFDDIVVMVPSIEAIEQSFPHLAENGVLNVFAGVARGTTATIDVSDICFKNVRIVGTSGSSIADMYAVKEKLEAGTLATGDSLAAIGGLETFAEGLAAVKNSRFSGKTVIYPHVENLPLTALPDLKTVRPAVYEKLRDGQFWTDEAEAALSA